jgi:uncharacterized protein
MMNSKEKLTALAAGLDGAVLDNGLRLSTERIGGEVDVLLVSVEDREEFPIYVTVDDSQILCLSYLWSEAEVKAERRAELLETLLIMNVPMPLSAFSKVGAQYIIFDALRIKADANEVLEAIYTLSDNTLTAIGEVREFLIK